MITADAYAEDPAQVALINAYRSQAEPLMKRVVGSTTAVIARGRTETGETALGDMIADSMLAAARRAEPATQIAFMNPGGIRADLPFNPGGQLTFADIEKKIADFGKRAGEGKLGLEELTGGTFSISNGGVFGSMLSTPIINPPQSAILGIHATKERPVVENGQIVIRPMNYLAMSYDHRIIDGREAVLSLVAMREALEDPARLLLEV